MIDVNHLIAKAKLENAALAKEIKVITADHYAALMAKCLEIEELKELENENMKLQ